MKIDLVNIPQKLSPRIIGSASDYIITAQCLRNLVRIDPKGQLSGDFASSWTVSKDRTTYSFKVKIGEKFSNGEVMTAQDAVQSLLHPDFRRIAIHFDFSTIKSISAVENTIRVELNSPNPGFLYHLTQPEFGIFHQSDRGSEAPTLKVSSGPYFLVSATRDEVVLQRNPHSIDKGPEQLVFVGLGQKKFAALENRELDLALLWEDPSVEQMNRFSSSPDFDVLKPHVGFTFWITLNPSSEHLKDERKRRMLQLTLKKSVDSLIHPTNSWSHAYQLFLPDGPGRIQKEWTAQFWKKRETSPTLQGVQLKALISKSFQFNSELKKAFKAIEKETGSLISVVEYQDQSEFQQKLKSEKWDLYLINNDFSSFELVQNLVVTFNKEKPLIQLPADDRSMLNLWSEILKEEISEMRHQKIELLAQQLLQKALIVPVVYKNVQIIKKKEVDLTGWSQLFPEFAFWKVRFVQKKSKN